MTTLVSRMKALRVKAKEEMGKSHVQVLVATLAVLAVMAVDQALAAGASTGGLTSITNKVTTKGDEATTFLETVGKSGITLALIVSGLMALAKKLPWGYVGMIAVGAVLIYGATDGAAWLETFK